MRRLVNIARTGSAGGGRAIGEYPLDGACEPWLVTDTVGMYGIEGTEEDRVGLMGSGLVSSVENKSRRAENPPPPPEDEEDEDGPGVDVDEGDGAVCGRTEVVLNALRARRTVGMQGRRDMAMSKVGEAVDLNDSKARFDGNCPFESFPRWPKPDIT